MWYNVGERCGQNAEFFSVKSNGKNPNHSVLKDQNVVGQAWRSRIPFSLHVDLHVKASGWACEQ